MRIISGFSLFAILVSAGTAFSLDISSSISSRATLTVSRMEGFDYKTQGGNSLELGTLLEWGSCAITGILGVHGTEASNLGGGWGYRGYEGVHLRLQGEFPLSPLSAGGGTAPVGTNGTSRVRASTNGTSAVRAGVGGGSGGFFSRYRETDQVIFYPSVYAFLFLDAPTGSPKVRVRYTFPFEWYFRKDLATSFSFGLSIGVLYTWTGPGEGDK